MKRLLALLWLAVALGAAAHVAFTAARGLPLETDLMALLPTEERDAAIGAAKARMLAEVSGRVVMLVGHPDRNAARTAAAALRDGLTAAGLIASGSDVPAPEAIRQLGQTLFPHRAGLLSTADRTRLEAGDGEAVVRRALSQIYGIGGIADARLLGADPFLLFPAFLADLPLPASRLTMDEGWPTVADGGLTWVVVSARLVGEPYALAVQDRFTAAVDAALAPLASPELRVKRLGAVFYAQAGARTAMAESSMIGSASLVGTAVLMLAVFRSAGPLLLTVLASVVGLGVATSACLAWFGQVHATAMMFGAGLIGASVDYGLHYFSRVFGGQASPEDRLAHVRTAILLGLATSLIGYGALAVAPLPGLRQVAVFSSVGLAASCLTVVLWFPLLDRVKARRMSPHASAAALALWRLWEEAGLTRLRLAVVVVLTVAGLLGATRLRLDDDVRRQQALDPILAAEQAEIQRLIGFGAASQFFLVQAADTEAALRLEERLGERLGDAVAGWRSPARFVPSAARQRDNARLVAERLEQPHLAPFRAGLGMPAQPAAPPPERPLALGDLLATGALPLLPALVIGEGVHVVALDGIADLGRLRHAADGLDGVRFVDPTADLGALLGTYRQRALLLLAASALLMAPLMMARYGARGGLIALGPPLAAVLLTPPLLALAGIPFTFFAAMALVLVLSIGVDYAVFCAETEARRDPVVVLAVALATLTTVLSFGLLAFSQVPGVRSFGAVMLVGITLAFVLSPLAAGGSRVDRP